MGRPGIEPTTIDLSFQSGAYDLSAMATPKTKTFPMKKIINTELFIDGKQGPYIQKEQIK